MELGLKRGTVRIDKYNSEWKNEYLKEEKIFNSGDWSGFAINKEDPNYTAQIFAGVGIDFLFIGQGTINVSFDLVNQIWAGGLSLRVKF